MLRRHFLLATAAGLAARRLALPAAAPAVKLDRIGLELYAVRKAMKADPERTLAAIREIGYTDVELLWSFKNFDRSVKQVKEALKNTGLKAPSAHMGPDAILTEWNERLYEAKELGHQYLIVAGLPAEANKSIEVWKLWAQRFNAAGEDARRAGIWLAFHNEPAYEKKIMGEYPLEVFLKETDPKAVRFQLDVGNMLAGGGDPMAFFRRHEKRIGSFHLKDIIAGTTKDTELGKGGFDLKAFLSQVPDLAKKPCYVEQEGSADEMGSAKANYEFLRGLSW